MYSFIDVTGVQGVQDLPAEALSINGIYIENIIPGYRTLYVAGRELAPAENDLETVGSSDGAILRNHRKTSRSLRVGYQLTAPDSETFRARFDALTASIDVVDARLIFNDENDKFYIGTYAGTEDVGPGYLSIVSEFRFDCPDPHKYSVDEYTAAAIVGEDGLPVFTVNYDGTVLSRPTLEAVLTAESGFIGFADGEENLIQLGDYDEQDGVTREKDVMCLNTPTSSAWSTWSDNVATIQSGAQTGTPNKSTVLTISSYGSGTGWHGPSVTADVSASAIINGKCSFKYRFQTPNSSTGKKQAGLMTFIAMGGTSGAKTKICEVQLEIKGGSHTGYAYIFIAGVKVGTIKFASNKSNAFTSGTVVIEKLGSKFNISVGGKTYSYNNSSLQTATINFVGCYTAKYKTTATPSSYVTVTSASVLKHNVEYWDEIENKFQPGDIVKVDCAAAQIWVDGILTNKLGALGNDWEKFGLRPGTNVILCDASSWVSAMPSFSMKYRKVWI